MGKLFNPSKRTFSGPWILDNISLEELNEIVEFANYELKKTHNENIEATALKDFEDKNHSSLEEAKNYALKHFFNRTRKDITLISEDESKLTDGSIKELLVDPKIKTIMPKELSVEIEYGRLNIFSFNIKQRYDGELGYEVKSTKSEVEDEINYKLENWIEKYKPLYIQSLWLKFAIPIALLAGFILLTFASTIFSTYKPSSIEVYKDQIEAIIVTGIDDNNQHKALELLLKVNSGYVPSDIKEETRINETAKRISIISLAFLIIGVFKPPTLIGIGRHKNKLKFYRIYMKFILYIIPAIFIYPYLVDFIKNLI